MKPAEEHILRQTKEYQDILYYLIGVVEREFPGVALLYKWKMPFFLLQIATGKVHLSKHVEIIQAKKMEITTNNTLLHLDGEPYKASNPVIINLLENSLKILKPNE